MTGTQNNTVSLIVCVIYIIIFGMIFVVSMFRKPTPPIGRFDSHENYMNKYTQSYHEKEKIKMLKNTIEDKNKLMLEKEKIIALLEDQIKNLKPENKTILDVDKPKN